MALDIEFSVKITPENAFSTFSPDQQDEIPGFAFLRDVILYHLTGSNGFIQQSIKIKDRRPQ